MPLGHDGAIAHAAPDGRVQPLDDHLRNVSRLAAEFGREVGCSEWAGFAGLWHDLGKYSGEFQKYIRESSDVDGPEAATPGKVDHSTFGAVAACRRFGTPGRLLAYAVAGHHCGLPDWESEESGLAGLAQRLVKTIPPADPPAGLMAHALPSQKPKPGTDPAMWVRMLFSCLVDADCLDTEAFVDPDKSRLRGMFRPLDELKPLFDQYMRDKAAGAAKSKVNALRAEVLAQCIRRSNDPPGIFTLTVPTGGGKTLSSMAFALGHALRHGKRRVIYVIPYTSIIEQTAEQFREVFGDDVVEHHSNVEPPVTADDSSYRHNLATDNWDAPVVVTTTVQFFESLFAARPGRCRKLHNIANSVVILDEAQLLPPELLSPILQALTELSRNYGVTLVLSTATQPAFTPMEAPGYRFAGLPPAQEIIDDPGALYEQLRRVEVSVPKDFGSPVSWADLAAELEAHPTVLCVVSRRDDCRKLHALMPPGTAHLSALMCGAHRTKVIAEVKRRLKDGEPTRVVSTQLVEAGVDLDFPVVYRALAGLDSVAQAAGRCNREGRLPELGKVVVFTPESLAPPGLLRMAAGIGGRMLANSGGDPLAPERFTAYFRELYWLHGERLDSKGVLKDLESDPELRFSFRTAAAKFRVIDETQYAPVFVRYGDNGALLARLEKEGPERWLMRKLQRSVVNVPRYLLDRILAAGAVAEPFPGVYVQTALGEYDSEVGFLCDGERLNPDELIV
jgi:CRISPR-associated endonuclease/helicase Cas3